MVQNQTRSNRTKHINQPSFYEGNLRAPLRPQLPTYTIINKFRIMLSAAQERDDRLALIRCPARQHFSKEAFHHPPPKPDSFFGNLVFGLISDSFCLRATLTRPPRTLKAFRFRQGRSVNRPGIINEFFSPPETGPS
jgi:hypothetical protein